MNKPLAAALLLALPPTATAVAAVQVVPYEIGARPLPRAGIDEIVLEQLEELGIQPAFLCSDEVFLRRVYLDVIGTLPTPAEARAFLSDEDPDRRSRLIDSLLERDEFADYWAMKWGDLLRVKAEFPINLWPNAVQAYHRWIRTSIQENVPYSVFVREMLTASGSNFRVPQVNFYRALQGTEPEAIAKVVALTFMGTRTETWPEERLAGMATFFARIGYKGTGEWKEEIVFFDVAAGAADGRERGPRRALLPDGTSVELPEDRDPREVFADWLISAENPWFARSIANRVWYWLQGRGIVHPVDDLRPDNPPANAKLLAWLERELIDSGYDLKHLFRQVLRSQTYQLSSIPRSQHPLAEASFAHYPVRRLDAEVLIDALCQITGTTEEYSSPIPEPFTFIPEDQRSVALRGGSITSPFLELFGRPPRDTGLESERSNATTATQRLHLLNSSHIQRKLQESRKLRAMLKPRGDPRKTVSRAYLLVLSRYPTRRERQTIDAYMKSGEVKGREGAVDVVWALINSAEFLYRH